MHALLLPVPLSGHDSNSHNDTENFDAYITALLPPLNQLNHTIYGNLEKSTELFENDCKALEELDRLIEQVGLGSRLGGIVKEEGESGVDSDIKKNSVEPITQNLAVEEEDKAFEGIIRKLCELLEVFASLWTPKSGLGIDQHDDGREDSDHQTQSQTSPGISQISEHKQIYRRDALGYEMCRRLGSWGIGDCGSELPNKRDVPLWEHIWRYTSCWSRTARKARLPGQTENNQFDCMGLPGSLWLTEFCVMLFRWRKGGWAYKMEMERSGKEQEERMRREHKRAYQRALRREEDARIRNQLKNEAGTVDVSGSSSAQVLPVHILPTDYDSNDDDDDDDDNVNEEEQLPYRTSGETAVIARTSVKDEPPTYGPTPTFDETWFHISIEGWQRRVAVWKEPIRE
jgi:hypothetical protein